MLLGGNQESCSILTDEGAEWSGDQSVYEEDQVGEGRPVDDEGNGFVADCCRQADLKHGILPDRRHRSTGAVIYRQDSRRRFRRGIFI